MEGGAGISVPSDRLGWLLGVEVAAVVYGLQRIPCRAFAARHNLAPKQANERARSPADPDRDGQTWWPTVAPNASAGEAAAVLARAQHAHVTTLGNRTPRGTVLGAAAVSAAAGLVTAIAVGTRQCDVVAAAACAGLVSNLMARLAPPGYSRAAHVAALAGSFAAIPALFSRVLPMPEIERSYAVLAGFSDPELLRRHAALLLLVTANVQVAMGLLGVQYLRSHQFRKIMLTLVGKTMRHSMSPRPVTARTYTRGVFAFIALVAAPYMLQRTVFETVNAHQHGLFRAFVEEQFRLRTIFGGADSARLAVVARSNMTVDAHADSLDTLVNLNFRIVEAKLFSQDSCP